jgi:DUF1009 family protein
MSNYFIYLFKKIQNIFKFFRNESRRSQSKRVCQSENIKIGIIAGSGDLPRQLIENCIKRNLDYFVLAIEGHASPTLFSQEIPHQWIRLGSAALGFDIFHNQKVNTIVMAGGVRRPSLSELQPNWRTSRFIARLGYKILGDDSLLKVLTSELEREGFRVVSVESLFDSILAEEGVWGNILPQDIHYSDIKRGFEIGKIIGSFDVGQALIIQQGVILAIEAAEGTDAMIRRVQPYSRSGSKPVLVKLMKPGQEKRVDRPTIGLETIKLCHQVGIAGIAVEAQEVVVMDRVAIIKYADEFGLFLFGYSGDNL